VDIPPAPTFPYEQTIYTLPDGSKQPMYWKTETKKAPAPKAADPLALVTHSDITQVAYHAWFPEGEVTWGPLHGPGGLLTVTKHDSADYLSISALTIEPTGGNPASTLGTALGGVLGIVQDGPSVMPVSKPVFLKKEVVDAVEKKAPGFRAGLKTLGATEGPDGNLMIWDPKAFVDKAQALNANVPPSPSGQPPTR
jgi:hypothetical protein